MSRLTIKLIGGNKMIIQTVGGLIQEKDGLIYVWLKGNDFIRVYNYASTQACFSVEFGYIPVSTRTIMNEETFTELVERNHVKMKDELLSIVAASIKEETLKNYEQLAERKKSGVANKNTTTVRRMQIKMDVIKAAGILTDEEIKSIEDRFLVISLSKV